ncbi:MAG: hypothetical protein AB1597_00585 [Chloroflexota bacterium]
MPNTSILKTPVEDFVRDELTKAYPRMTFTEKPVPIGVKRDGSIAKHKFDAVSSDGTVIASIKSHSWKTSGGKIPSGKIGEIYQSLYFLSLAKAKTKLLIFTNKDTRDGFERIADGKVPSDVKIKYLQLPPKLQLEVTKVIRLASDEMKRLR